ncbi:MAG: hypothetical protein ABI969_18190, partial [bacterium]
MSHSLERPRVARQPRHLASQTISLAVLVTAAIAACSKVGEDVLDHETAPFDKPIRAWVLARQSELGRRFFLVITNAGSPTILIPLTGAVA